MLCLFQVLEMFSHFLTILSIDILQARYFSKFFLILQHFWVQGVGVHFWVATDTIC